MSLDFALSLEDKMSAPAGSAADSIDRLAAAIDRATAKAGESDDAIEKHGMKWTELASKLEVVTKIYEGVKHAMEFVLDLAKEPFRFAAEASEARKESEEFYEQMLGSAKAGEEVYEKIRQIARLLPQGNEQIQALSRKLIVAGVSNDEALAESIKSIATLQAVGLEGGAKKIEKLITKAAQGEKFSVNEKTLIGTGIHIADLYANIAGRLGVGVDQVKTLLKQGKVNAETGIDALNDVVSEKFGKLADGKVFTFGALKQKLHDNLASLFDGIDFKPLLGALKNVVDLFDKGSDSGSVFAGGIKAGIQGVVDWVAAKVPYLEILFYKIATAGVEFYIALRPGLAALDRAFGGGDKASSWADSIGNAFIGIAKTVGEIVSSIMEAIAGIKEQADQSGSGFIEVFAEKIGMAVAKAIKTGVTETVIELIPGVTSAAQHKINTKIKQADTAFEARKTTTGAVNADASLKDMFALITKADPEQARNIQIKGDLDQIVAKNQSNFAVRTLEGALAVAAFEESIRKAAASLGAAGTTGAPQTTTVAHSPPREVSLRGASGASSGGGGVHIENFVWHVHGVANAEELRQIIPAELAKAFEELNLMGGG